MKFTSGAATVSTEYLFRCEKLQPLKEILGRQKRNALMCKSGDMHNAKNTTTVHSVYLKDMGKLCPFLLFDYRKSAVNTKVLTAFLFAVNILFKYILRSGQKKK